MSNKWVKNEFLETSMYFRNSKEVHDRSNGLYISDEGEIWKLIFRRHRQVLLKVLLKSPKYLSVALVSVGK